MRITGGQARGIPIKAPKQGVRPATDYLREAVFSSLGPDRVTGARVLDCFAGTGAYGLEALSRGAASVCFIEQDRAALQCLEQNTAAVAKALQAEPRSITDHWRGDFFKAIARSAESFDLIFADPPWSLWEERGADILSALLARLNDSPDARLIAEAPGAWSPTLGGGGGSSPPPRQGPPTAQRAHHWPDIGRGRQPTSYPRKNGRLGGETGAILKWFSNNIPNLNAVCC